MPENGLPDHLAEVYDLLDESFTPGDELAASLDMQADTVRSYCRRMRNDYGVEIESTQAGYRLPPSEDDSSDGEEPDVVINRENTAQPEIDGVPDTFLSKLRGNGLTYRDMKTRYNWSESQARRILDEMSQAGWAIDFEIMDAQGTRRWYIPEERDKRYQIGDGDGTYRFGLISDTHLGSEATHLGHLHDFYDKMQDRGVDIVLHAGDISDGWGVHQNQINEVHAEAAGWDRLKEYVVKNYPQRDGVQTLFISGNHDRKLWRREGIRFSELVAEKRDDLTWLGDSMARLVFDPENHIDLELIHPSGGQPYTIGYRAQTLYRDQPLDIRPSMTAIGHLHGRLQAAAEGVEAWYTGCWKDLTTYGKRKGHAAEIGGWDVQLEIEDGEISRIGTFWEKYPADDAERGSVADLPDIGEMVGADASADSSADSFLS